MNIHTALDVGNKDGRIYTRLAERGTSVDSIAINPLPLSAHTFHFEQISLADFLAKNTKVYDLVVVRHVLHLLPNPEEMLAGLNKISKVLFFTCFGSKDGWHGKVSTLDQDQVLKLFEPQSVRHRSESFQYGKTYSGEMKFWHINTFVIDNHVQ